MPRKPKSKFTSIKAIQVARVMYELGATDAQVSDAIGVSRQALDTWKKETPSALDTIKAAKAKADNEVEKALYKRAIGCDIPDTHFSSYEGKVTATPCRKHIAPSEVACIFWLKNRKPADWKDRSEHTVSNPDGSNLIPQELISAAAAVAKSL